MAGSGKSSSKKKEQKAPSEVSSGMESVYKREPGMKTTLQQIEKHSVKARLCPGWVPSVR